MYQNPTLFCILFLAFGLLSCSEEPDWTAENVLDALGEETGRKDIVSRGICPSNHKCYAKVLRLRLEDVCTSHVSVSIQTRAKFLLRRLRRGGMRDGDMKHVRIDTMTDTSKVEEWEGWLDVKKNHATFPEHPFRSPRGQRTPRALPAEPFPRPFPSSFKMLLEHRKFRGLVYEFDMEGAREAIAEACGTY